MYIVLLLISIGTSRTGTTAPVGNDAMGGSAAKEKSASSPIVETDSTAKGRSLSLFVLASMVSEVFSLAAGSIFSSMAGCALILGSLSATVGRWLLPSHAALPSR